MLLLVFCSLTSWIPSAKQEVAMLVMEVSGVKAPYCFFVGCFHDTEATVAGSLLWL